MNRMILVFLQGLLMLPLAALAVSDEALPDPTRPAIAEVKATPVGDVPAAFVLQSIILRKGRKAGAVINGQIVEVGEEILGSRLTRVTETAVTLVSESGKDILKLTPAVEKKPVADISNAKSMGTSKKQAAGKVVP